MISCEDLSVTLPGANGPVRILDGVRFSVHRGEFVSVLGVSGAGKTTLLRVLGGLQQAFGGTVSCDGAAVSGPPDGVVMVFQYYTHSLLPWRTVRRNVALGIEKLDRSERDSRVGEALAMVGLADRDDEYPWRLSGGMQQRVQIARALALRPSVLLMDEPFAALDAMTKAQLQDELHRLRDATGSSFVFVTHDIEEAVYLGDRVAVITGAPGRIERTVQVDLPKPRDQIVTRQMPKFLELRYLLHQAIGQSEHA
jgi:NitT/TauT family transport system ATP-binding protein